MISPSELAAIRARAEHASPGPLSTKRNAGLARTVIYSESEGGLGMAFGATETDEANAAFWAASRTDVPALLSDAAECRALIAEMVEALTRLLEANHGEIDTREGQEEGIAAEAQANVALSRAREAVESPLERFERIAAEFERDTGMLRPGKDVPAAMGSTHTDEERAERFAQWMKERKP